MRLLELQAQAQGSAIDQQLQRVANGIGQNQNQPDSPVHAQPDMQQDDQQDQDEAKSADSYLVSAVKDMPYATDYKFDEAKPTHPYKILQMDLHGLYNLRNIVRNKINMKAFSNTYGLYDDPGMKFYQDMVSYVEKVITVKKQDGEKDSSAQQINHHKAKNATS